MLSAYVFACPLEQVAPDWSSSKNVNVLPCRCSAFLIVCLKNYVDAEGVALISKTADFLQIAHSILQLPSFQLKKTYSCQLLEIITMLHLRKRNKYCYGFNLLRLFLNRAGYFSARTDRKPCVRHHVRSHHRRTDNCSSYVWPTLLTFRRYV